LLGASVARVRWLAGVGGAHTRALSAGARPSASQPSSVALPILPAPASRMVPERSASGRGLFCGFGDELMTALPPVVRNSGKPEFRRQVGFTRLAALFKRAELGQARVPTASRVYPTCGTP